MSSKISEETRARVRTAAKDCCGYCCSQQKYVLGMLEIDHIIPTAQGGTDDEKNLWLACRLCNSFKGTQTHRRDPETDRLVQLLDLLQNQKHVRFISFLSELKLSDEIRSQSKSISDRI